MTGLSPGRRLILFHKPYDVLSQFTPDHPGQRTLAEFSLPKSVYPVGRLDRDSEGLLLLTDDNRLKTALLDPNTKTSKTYWVQVEGTPDDATLERLRTGVEFKVKGKSFLSLPAEADLLTGVPPPARTPPIRFRKTVSDAWLELSITEGKNRQVRRMCAAVGLPVLRLLRTRVGVYPLEDLPPGHWRALS